MAVNVAVNDCVTAIPLRWTVPDRFRVGDLGGGRSVVVDLDHLTSHEIATEGAALLRMGDRRRLNRNPDHVAFLKAAVSAGWIRSGANGQAEPWRQ